jgi:ketosteroid isomerase-like protein
MPAYTPAELHPLFQHAFNLGDADALSALYEARAVLIIDGERVAGRDAIRKAFAGLVSPRSRMSLETRAVIESHEGLAVLHGRWTVQPEGSWLFVIDSPRTPQ